MSQTEQEHCSLFENNIVVLQYTLITDTYFWFHKCVLFGELLSGLPLQMFRFYYCFEWGKIISILLSFSFIHILFTFTFLKPLKFGFSSYDSLGKQEIILRRVCWWSAWCKGRWCQWSPYLSTLPINRLIDRRILGKICFGCKSVGEAVNNHLWQCWEVGTMILLYSNNIIFWILHWDYSIYCVIYKSNMSWATCAALTLFYSLSASM